MPQYDVYVSCSECGVVHPMGVRVYLEHGPAGEQSIGETYKGAPLPPQISAIERRKVLCLKTGKLIVQENLDQIFLLPIRLGF